MNENKLNKTYTVGMNQFGDLTNAEFKEVAHGFRYRKQDYSRSKNTVRLSTVSLPTYVNWNDAGAVTPVKDQGQCGSCWSFSATGSIEGAYFISRGQLNSLSEQQLMDCSTAYGNMGCEGGEMDAAFQYVIANGGLTSEANYPYQAADGQCMNPLPPSVSSISSYQDVTTYASSQLQAAAAIGPVSVAIEADSSSFQFYSGGVYSDPGCGTNLDHGVLVVGYNVAAGSTPYWIVKNSWGASWGLQGYIYIVITNANGQDPGECGINMDPSYPIV